MCNHVAKFDIRNVDGQNVPQACKGLRAISKALGSDLPSNAVRCVLAGMANASSSAFVEVCKTNMALMSSSLYKQSNVYKNLTTSECLDLILGDLETKYKELITNNEWAGIGHEASSFKAAMFNEAIMMEYEADASAFAARTGKRLPFKDWVKTATCDLCGEKGHIKPQCPKNPKNPNRRLTNGFRGSSTRGARGSSFQRNRPMPPKKPVTQIKALQTYLEELMLENEAQDQEEEVSDEQGQDDEDGAQDDEQSEEGDMAVHSAIADLHSAFAVSKE